MTDTPQPLDPTSIFGKLQQQREEEIARQTLVLPVPRWQIPIKVRYKLIDHEIIRRSLSKIDGAKESEKGRVELDMNCDVLVAGCVEVWGELDNDRYSLRPDDPRGDFTTFDKDLGMNLGLNESCTARQVVRKLFLSEGDIISTAGTLIEWCGYKRDGIEEDLDKG